MHLYNFHKCFAQWHTGMDDWFANTEQAMTPDTDGGADIEQMHMDYLDTTPDVNVEFGEIMQPETGGVQHSKNYFLFLVKISE